MIDGLVNSLNLNYNPEYSGEVALAYPHFCGNYGFFDIFFGKNRVVLLKSVHKDFIRVISGEKWLSDRVFSKLSDLLSDVEKNLEDFINISFYVEDDVIYIKGINTDLQPLEKSFKRVNFPLTRVEYNLFRDEIAKDKTIWGRCGLNTFLPDNMTRLMTSIIKKVPDVLNPMFEYANFRTYSPSVKIIFNKPYINVRNLNSWSNTLGIDDFYLNINYIQHMFLKNSYRKIKIPDVRLLKIDDAEIDQLIDEIESKIMMIDQNFVLKDEFYEYISLIVMIHEMLAVQLCRYFLEIYRIFDHLETTLNAIYKTRETRSILSEKFEYFEFFDFNADKLVWDGYSFADAEDMDKYLKMIPLMGQIFGKNKLINNIKMVHSYLDRRDRIFFLSYRFMERIRDSFLKLGVDFVEKAKIKREKDIFYLEIDEIKQITEDSFYGNLAFNIYFRKTQGERFKMQRVPSEIYEKDIPESEEIYHSILSKFADKKSIPAITIGHKEDVQEVAIIDNTNFYNIKNIKDYQGVVAENIPIFSYLMEFIVLTGKTLATGVRMPEDLFSGKKISIRKNMVTVDE
ncbi:MAG: hypothetical protein LDL13_07640 [Calditerrivibrio sp.]|nr:hypothetical protein [Calditerrivibrio sp.]